MSSYHYYESLAYRKPVDPYTAEQQQANRRLYESYSRAQRYSSNNIIFSSEKRRKKKRRLRILAVIGILLLVIIVLCQAVPASLMTKDLIAPISTPRSEWHKGEMPYLYQIDSQWSEKSYSGGTMAENGCGPTSLAMVYIYLTGSDQYDPVAMGNFAQREGYAVDGATAWSFMNEGASQLGLTSEQLPADPNRVRDELAAGHPIICIMGPGDFTTTGHFIVLSGITEDGRIVVHDPNSEVRSSMTWELETILNQCQNLWAYSI